MEARTEYFEIIGYRLQNPLPKEEYGENHHIYPKSCGGSNKKSNLVRLTPEEHYRCHCLLPYIFKETGDEENYKKMLSAWHFMHTTHKGIHISEEEYGKLRREAKIALATCGHKGYLHSAEAKAKMREAKIGKAGHGFSIKTKKQISEKLKGHPVSEETRKKLGSGMKKKAERRAFEREIMLWKMIGILEY